MCGIVGWVGGRVSPEERERVVRRMASQIRHRGPDDDGFLVAEGVGVGMRRLSIIDLAGGHQPIHDETGSRWVVLNGEIYNYRDLRRELSARHVFRTESDTEVIVHAYEDSGAACVERLRGMFAFALWDGPARTLLVGIDRLGIKPLYYAEVAAGLVFGSELKCLLASGLLDRALDEDGLRQYFTLGYIPAPWTIFRSARKLLPGHLLSWTAASGALVRAYWDVPARVEHGRSPAEVRGQLREHLRDAVRSHLVSDVPLGAFLSGGIDSSAVVALMREAGVSPVRTFTIGFADPAHDERRAARRVATWCGTEHHEWVVEPEGVDLAPALVAAFDEPFADPAALPIYYVSKLARERVTVALSGDGGDELFLGYRTFQGLEVARHVQRLPASGRRLVEAALERAAPMAHRWDRTERWAKRAADSLLPPAQAYRSKMSAVRWSTVAPLLSRELRARLAGRNPYALVDECLGQGAADPAGHPLAPFVYAGLKVSLPGDMLVKIDRMSMAHSLEVRVPFLDHRLVEFAARIPIEQRFPRWRLKGLLRDSLAGTLPPDVLRRRKHGFTVPLNRWFRQDLRAFAADVLLSEAARKRGFLDAAAVDRLLRGPQRGAEVGPLLWCLLVFELWCRHAGVTCAS